MNRRGQVTALRLTVVPRAIGGNIRSGLALRLPASLTAIGSVTRTLGGAPQSLTAARDGETDVVVTVSEDLRELFGGSAESFVNTHRGSGVRPGDGQQVVVDILLSSPVSLDLSQEPFDLFFFRTQDRSHEVHRPQFSGTHAMDRALFNTGSDASSSARRFVDGRGLPFVVAVPELVAWTQEGTRIEALFPAIVGFAASGGALEADFYERSVGTAAYPSSAGVAAVPGTSRDDACAPQRCRAGYTRLGAVCVADNPAPVLGWVSPADVRVGSADFELTVSGSGFVRGSVVHFGGAALSTTFVAPNQLVATVPASLVASPASTIVTVVNPPPAGGTSGAASFTVVEPVCNPDVAIGGMLARRECSMSRVRLGVWIDNNGSSAMPAGVRVAIYEGEPSPASPPVAVVTTDSPVEPFADVFLSTYWSVLAPAGTNLVAIVEDDGQGPCVGGQRMSGVLRARCW